MQRRFPAGPWAPDLPPLQNQGGLAVARNVVPVAGGYGPIGSPVTLGTATAIDAYPRGSFVARRADTTFETFVGDASKLYRLTDSGFVDASAAGGYSLSGDRRWEFAQFADNVFACSRHHPLQAAKLGGTQAFERVANSSLAGHIAVGDNFVMLGDLYHPTLGNLRNAITWSANGNPFSYPEPGTDEAIQALSDLQVLEGNGGIVNKVIAGSEVFAIFQERAIWRADFTGGPEIFTLRRVEPDVGCIVKGAAVAFERLVFFLAEDGFRVFDYTSSKNIGKDRVNDFFFADFDARYPGRVTVERDPMATRVVVSYPGAGNVDGQPNKLLYWDWELDRFTEAELAHEGVAIAARSAPSLDSPGTAADPSELEGVTDSEGRDVGLLSFDDAPFAPGEATLGVFSDGRVLSSLTGPSLEGLLESGHLEVFPGRRARVTAVRPLVDGEEASVEVGTLDRRPMANDADDQVAFGESVAVEHDGNCYLLADGRYHVVRMLLPREFTEATGFDLEAAQGGVR